MLPTVSVDKKFDIVSFSSAYEYKWDQNFVFLGENHEQWEIVLVTDGCVEVTEDEKIYRLGAKDMILHASMEFHRIRSSEGSSPSVMVMSFMPVGALPSELKNGVFTLNDTLFNEYLSVFKNIYRIIHGTDEDKYFTQEASAMLSAFLIHLAKTPKQQMLPLSNAATNEYKKAVRAMSDGICENLTLPDIAKRCNISVSYLKFLFAKYAGVSPKTYYSNLRIQHSCELLKQGMSVTDVANTVNFSSPNYFCVFFKRHIGISPLEYQKKLLKQQALH